MHRASPFVLVVIALAAVAALSACSRSTTATTAVTTTTTTTGSSAATSLQSGYKLAKWASNVTVTYPSNCAMTISSDGLPNHATATYYLEPPNSGYTTVVAQTPSSGMRLVVVPFTGTARRTSMTINSCPVKAATTTATSGGGIGWMISGPSLFNATEGVGSSSAALTDNVSYSFSVGGTAFTASFIDDCNGHPTPVPQGNSYHYHGLPPCVTAQVDVAGGPSHIIGVALDGFPIYGGNDINGKTIAVSQLDACNGITSATPEFPNGVYHYVLPAGVTGFQSSLRCYSGRVTIGQIAAMQARGFCVTNLVNSFAQLPLQEAMRARALPHLSRS